MSKLNYKNFYEMELKAYKELYDKLEKEDIIIEHNMLSGEVKVHNIALEKCKKEYRESVDELNVYIQDKNKTIKTQENHISQLINKYNDLKEEFEELSDNYFTLKTKYDEICGKYSFSETLRDILVKYIINN